MKARKLRLLRDHGSPAKYQHSVIGTNARLDSLQAAILSIKLCQLDQWNQLRRKHAGANGVSACTFSRLYHQKYRPAASIGSICFVVRTSQRNALRDYLRANGIGTGIHYPVLCI